MLRVDTSNLPEPRGLPRSRRLLPNPPVPPKGLITPDLSGLLRRTRITLTESPAAAQAQSRVVIPPDEPTLPRTRLPAPPRIPRESEPAADVVEGSPVQSVAPAALDVEPSAKPG